MFCSEDSKQGKWFVRIDVMCEEHKVQDDDYGKIEHK